MCKFLGKSKEHILCKLSKSEILRLYLIVYVAMQTTKTSHFICQSKSFISIYTDEMTLIWTYVVLNPLVLLKRSYFPFTMWLVIMLLMILLLTDLMQFSTLVYHQKLKHLTIIFLK